MLTCRLKAGARSLASVGGIFETRHHLDELFELDLTIAVLVHLLDDCVHSLLTKRVGTTKAEDFSDLVRGDDTRSILVKHAESSMKLLLTRQLILACGGNDEFSVVDETTVVGVDRAEHIFHFLVAHNSTIMLQVALLHFIHG